MATYGEQHRRINNRPKRCAQCGLTVQAGNLARHQRRHATEYGYTTRGSSVPRQEDGAAQRVNAERLLTHPFDAAKGGLP